MAKKKDTETDARPIKERVLHTRVPAVLDQELKRLAKSLRVPVSNVVRSILEDALSAVETVGRRAEGELHSATDRIARERERIRQERHEGGGATRHEAVRPPLAGVLGFVPFILVKPAACALTGQPLGSGTEALSGIDEETGRRVIVAKGAFPVQVVSGADAPAIGGNDGEE